MHVNAEPYQDIIGTAQRLIDGDCTVNRYGVEVEATAGYAVGGACAGFSVWDSQAIAPEVLRAVALWIQRQPSNVRYFGSWRDSGRVHFDGVDIVTNGVEAMALAIVRGEQAIYSFASGECIDVEERAA